jgi:hypothetical protein
MTYTVHDLHLKYGVSEHTVLGWINRGLLRAINVAGADSGNPRWRISEDALADFERVRSSTPQPSTTPRRRKSADTEIIQRY